MSEEKCIIYYDLILNGNEYHPEMSWPVRVRRDDKDGEFCCEKFEEVFENGGLSFDPLARENYRVGEGYTSYDDWFFEPFKFCPYCGAVIEYALKYKYKMVNKPKDEWQRESYFE